MEPKCWQPFRWPGSTLLLMNHFFRLDGVIYSNAVTDYAAVVISYAVCIMYMKKTEK